MNLSIVLASPGISPLQLPSSRPNHSKSLRLTFLRPSTSLLRRRNRFTIVKNSATDEADASVAVDNSAVFGGKKELSGVQLLVGSLPAPVRLVSSLALVSSALAVGYGLGSRFGGSRNSGLAGAVALGAASGAAVYSMNASIPEVAAVNLHNFVASCDDPTALNSRDIEGIAKRYGVSKQDETFNSELCELYSSFVSSVLPPGGENLKGNEIETIIKFKSALGIDDPDAATAHMEIGRRIFRDRLETGDREDSIAQRRAFQKLIYVSTLVFGDASTFLLPWKRVFKVTDSQVEIAIRDNAQRLYALKLKEIGRDVDEKQLICLRETQVHYRLSDELAADMFREHARKLVEESISTALDIMKSRTRTVGETQVIDEIETVLAFNDKLMSLSVHPDSYRFALGVGPISLLGGEYDGDRKIEELKILYRVYATECFSSGHFEENKLGSLKQLKNIFGLGKREAESIMLEVTSKIYRKKLSQAVTSGVLEAADSKAAFLQNLCEELHFDPEKASGIHEEIYRHKLQQSVADGELSDEEVAALVRLRVMLCIPQKIVETAHTDICGTLFEKVVRTAVAAGAEGYDEVKRDAVRKAVRGLRLTSEAALDIAGKAVRKIFMNYIKQARSSGDHSKSAKELKQMITFNTIVVTDLVEDIKGEPADTTTAEEPVEEAQETKEEEEWDSLQTLKKTRSGDTFKEKLGRTVQTEITLKDDLPLKEKSGLYKTYLMFCISGETSKLPFGAQVGTKKDNTDFLALNQLGVLLGLSGKEIVDVHRNLAEQAFRKEAQVILADGQLTKDRVEQLDELQKKVGLPQEHAQKVIKSITTTKMASAMETAISQGRLSIKQIRELKGASVDLDCMISETLRENIFKKTIDEIFSSGTGDFDAEEVYEKIPADLSIKPEKAKGIVHELAKTRLSNSLIQAVSLLRQKKRAGVVSSLNDLLSCDKAVPSEPLTWHGEELLDLFAIYRNSNPAPEKLSRVQYLLGITDSAAASLKDVGLSLPVGAEEEEFVF